MIHFEISFDVPHSIMSSLIMLSFGLWVNMKRNTKHIWLLLSECLKILVAAVMLVLASTCEVPDARNDEIVFSMCNPRVL
jgi:hypothetical protein